MKALDFFDRVEQMLETAFEKVASLAELARELGGDVFLLLVAIALVYRLLSKQIPLLTDAWARDRRHKRNHERKMEELRVSYNERAKRAPKKKGR